MEIKEDIGIVDIKTPKNSGDVKTLKTSTLGAMCERLIWMEMIAFFFISGDAKTPQSLFIHHLILLGTLVDTFKLVNQVEHQ